ncbi:MAG: hypothetical protein ACFCGT_18595 [Sandaracinaceae bacterium]
MAVTARALSAPNEFVHRSEACTRLHGEASTDDTIAYGGDEGILIVSFDGGAFSSAVVDYPDVTGMARLLHDLRREPVHRRHVP